MSKVNVLKQIRTIILASLPFVLFQNCSPDVKFSGQHPSIGDLVCNPFDPTNKCDDPNSGLMGNLYYLTENDAPLVGGDLYKTVLTDYRDFGKRVPANIIMGNLNIPPQSWPDGFHVDSGTPAITDENGNVLIEWYHVDLSGNINLLTGRYQFASVSDDGIRVTIGGQVVNEYDGTHPPAWKCDGSTIDFVSGVSKSIRVEYFQGPRSGMALQVFLRLVEKNIVSCNQSDFHIVPSAALSN